MREWVILAGLFSVPAAAEECVTFRYDAIGRLVEAARLGERGRSRANYEYDGSSNRTKVQVRLGALSPVAGGSFEHPQLGAGFMYRPNVSGAIFSGATGIAGYGSGWGFPSAPDGQQVAFLQRPDGEASFIELNATGVVPGNRYIVRFKGVQRPGVMRNIITVTADGVQIFRSAPSSSGAFAQYTTASFVPGGTSVKVRFAAEETAEDTASGIDDVELELVGSSSGGPSIAGGSFENPAVGNGYIYQPSVTGVSFTGSAGIAGNASAWGFAVAPEGNQVGFLQATGSGAPGAISHQVSGLAPEETYTLRLKTAARPGYGTLPITVLINGEHLATIQPQSAQFESRCLAFKSSSSTATLTLSGGASVTDRVTAIDAIAVESQ